VAVDVLLLVPFLHEQLEKGALRSHRVGVDAVVVGAHFARLKPARLTGTDWHRGHPDRRLGRGLFCIIDLLLHLPLAREWRTTKSTKENVRDMHFRRVGQPKLVELLFRRREMLFRTAAPRDEGRNEIA
jgi:hypothetical protein